MNFVRITSYLSFFILILSSCKSKYTGDQSSMQYIGRQTCIECHSDEHNLYAGSHHDLAMEIANDTTVLGDFNDAVFNHNGIKSKLYKRDGEFFMYTDGPSGEMGEFKVKYTFGVYPLQQYLIEFPKGRYQCSPICWDSRPETEGGQRWFHIYDQEPIPHDDILHWTHTTQTWNFMCSECHSTNLKKNWDLETATYNTTWNEIDVSCEACHGPASEHLAWAEADEAGLPTHKWKDMGMAIMLADTFDFPWEINDSTGNAERVVPLENDKMIQLCARCHSRRGIISEDYRFGEDLLNTHDITLLDHVHYYNDGQILEEDYVYASFIQSKMYQKGVRCIDCHDPHSLELAAEGDALCLRCHKTEKFASRNHHFHDPEQEGARCIECHMDYTHYMVVDPRNDHSFRVPRPDLSLKIGTPNSCNHCHDDKSVKWAADYFEKWYDLSKYPEHFGEVFNMAQNENPAALDKLISIINNTEQTEIVKATAIYYLQHFPSTKATSVLIKLLKNEAPLLRATAIASSGYFADNEKYRYIFPLLTDSVRLVRMRATSEIASISLENTNEEKQEIFQKALAEYKEIQGLNSDVAGGLINLGIIHLQIGDIKKAEYYYKKAIETEPAFDMAFVNLADLMRSQGNDEKGKQFLHEGIEKNPKSSNIHHALGLLHARNKNMDSALVNLEKAEKFDAENARYQYVYAIALHSAGKSVKAIEVLKEATQHSPYNSDILYSLSTINYELGNMQDALKYIDKLIKLYPNNEQFVQVKRQIEAQM